MATSTKKPAAKATPGTAVAVKKANSGSLVSIKEQLAAMVAENDDKVVPSRGNTIRVTQDKFFLLPNGTKTPGPLELVVVEFASKNMYYENKFDAKNIVPPNCYAMGSNPLKLVPAAKAPEPQATDCNACMHSKFGPNSEAPECKGARVLAVMEPDAKKDSPIWLLATSPTAVRGFDNFVKSAKNLFDMPPIGVVVSVSFDPAQTYAKLVFSDPQPNVNVGTHTARLAEARAMLLVEPDVSKFVKAPVTRGRAPARR